MRKNLLFLLLAAALCTLHSTTARAQDDVTETEDETTTDGVTIDETNFPDEAFRSYVLETIDTDGDGKLSSGEISAVTTLNFSGGNNFTSLKGIEFFTELTGLDCSDNNLTELDVCGCTKLQYLYCNDNNLTILAISGCTKLIYLGCWENNLTTLDVSGCPNLQELSCPGNHLIAIDLSNNPNITSFYYSESEVADNISYFLDVLIDGKSYVPLTELEKYGFDKTRVDGSLIDKIDETEYLCLGDCNSEGARAELEYTYNTGNSNFPEAKFKIKRKFKVSDVEINETNFPDAIFRNYVQTNIDTDNNGILSPEEITEVSKIDNIAVAYNKDITSFEGVKYFIGLNWLSCVGNSLTSLDVSGLAELNTLACSENNLTTLDVSGCVELIWLYCYSNNLTKLDVSGCTKLGNFQCYNNKLVALDLSNNPNIYNVDASSNGNTFYDVIKDGQSYVPLTTLALYGFDKEQLVDQTLIENIDGVEYLCLGTYDEENPNTRLTYEYNTGCSDEYYATMEFTISRDTEGVKNVNLNTSGYTTYSNREPMTISGAEAYTAEVSEAESILWLTPIGNVVPANTGVLLIGEPEAEVTVTPGGEAPAIEHNDFIATVTSTPVSADTNPYVLSGEKFVRFTGENYSANKAHLELSADFATPDDDTSNAKQMLIAIMPTAISTPATTRRPANTTMYDLRGIRVNGKAKGIVIVNGKKIGPS